MNQVLKRPITDPWTWYYVFWALYVAVIQGLIGIALIFGPTRWVTFNSAGAIHRYSPWLPWWVVGIAFIVSGLCVLADKTRYLGYAIAFLIDAFYSVAAALFSIFSAPRPVVTPQATDIVNNHPNPIVIGLSFYAPLVMVAGVRYVLISRKQVTHG